MLIISRPRKLIVFRIYQQRDIKKRSQTRPRDATSIGNVYHKMRYDCANIMNKQFCYDKKNFFKYVEH